eukprot:Rmarinus@m.19924
MGFFSSSKDLRTQSGIDVKKIKKKELASRLSSVELHLSSSISENSSLKERATAAEEAHQSLQTQYERNAKSLAEARNANEKLSSKLASIIESLEKVRAERDGLETEIEEKDRSMDDLRASYDAALDEQSALQRALEDARAQQEGSQADMEALKQVAQDKSDALILLEQEYEALQGRAAAAVAEAEAAREAAAAAAASTPSSPGKSPGRRLRVAQSARLAHTDHYSVLPEFDDDFIETADASVLACLPAPGSDASVQTDSMVEILERDLAKQDVVQLHELNLQLQNEMAEAESRSLQKNDLLQVQLRELDFERQQLSSEKEYLQQKVSSMQAGQAKGPSSPRNYLRTSPAKKTPRGVSPLSPRVGLEDSRHSFSSSMQSSVGERQSLAEMRHRANLESMRQKKLIEKREKMQQEEASSRMYRVEAKPLPEHVRQAAVHRLYPRDPRAAVDRSVGVGMQVDVPEEPVAPRYTLSKEQQRESVIRLSHRRNYRSSHAHRPMEDPEKAELTFYPNAKSAGSPPPKLSPRKTSEVVSRLTKPAQNQLKMDELRKSIKKQESAQLSFTPNICPRSEELLAAKQSVSPDLKPQKKMEATIRRLTKRNTMAHEKLRIKVQQEQEAELSFRPKISSKSQKMMKSLGYGSKTLEGTIQRLLDLGKKDRSGAGGSRAASRTSSFSSIIPEKTTPSGRPVHAVAVVKPGQLPKSGGRRAAHGRAGAPVTFSDFIRSKTPGGPPGGIPAVTPPVPAKSGPGAPGLRTISGGGGVDSSPPSSRQPSFAEAPQENGVHDMNGSNDHKEGTNGNASGAQAFTTEPDIDDDSDDLLSAVVDALPDNSVLPDVDSPVHNGPRRVPAASDSEPAGAPKMRPSAFSRPARKPRQPYIETV